MMTTFRPCHPFGQIAHGFGDFHQGVTVNDRGYLRRSRDEIAHRVQLDRATSRQAYGTGDVSFADRSGGSNTDLVLVR